MAGASGAIITREIHRPDCIVITFSRKCECCGYVELRSLNTIVFYGSRKYLGNFTCTKCKSNTEVTIFG